MDYYKEKQFIAQVDEKDKILGKVEKWAAHKSGILHRAFTVALLYQGQYVLQHRKHLAFNGLYDLTTSSHQQYIQGKLQDDLDAINLSLEREWNLSNRGFGEPHYDGTIYYKAKDLHSEFTEHEMCHMYTVEMTSIPTPNLDYAYGYSLVDKRELLDPKSKIYDNLAPWVKKMIEEGLLK